MVKKLISFLIFLLFCWLIWAYSGRNQPYAIPQSHLSVVQSISTNDSSDRRLIGIQPYMEVKDYFYQATFKEKLNLYLNEARGQGYLNKKSVVLFPEYLGTWLVLQGEKQTIAAEKTLTGAMTLMVTSNLFEFGLFYLRHHEEKDKAAATIFRMKSRKMAKSYFQTFSELAKEFNTIIVAGSIILPEPRVINGELEVDPTGRLFNASFVFGSDGKIIGKPILKAFPIASEQDFISPIAPSTLPVFELPIGKTAVLVCADSWYADAYENAKRNKAELILVPSYCTGEGTMDNLWQGYSGYEEPTGTDLSDIGKITEQAAWEKYALPGQIGKTAANYGMNVFLRGELWDLGTDGQPFMISEGRLLEVKFAEKAGIWALNF
jgi:predicted amidohydrolase